MGIWRFIVVVALGFAWLMEGLLDRLASRSRLRPDQILTVWGNTLKKPVGDAAPARKFLAKRFASVPGSVISGEAAVIFSRKPGQTAGSIKTNNQ
jgi:hypothetical protein